MHEARGHVKEAAGLDVDRFGTAWAELEPRPPHDHVAEDVPRAVMVPAGPRAGLGAGSHHRRGSGFKGELTGDPGRDGPSAEAVGRDHAYRLGHAVRFCDRTGSPARAVQRVRRPAVALDHEYERTFKPAAASADANDVPSGKLSIKAGPIPDRLTIWPVDDGRYGVDATFQGASGYERAESHQAELVRQGVPHRFQQELDGGWTLRFGPLAAIDVARGLAAFVY
jgi:hypothetical protein